jgi:glutaconate CoA-transferase subunit A
MTAERASRVIDEIEAAAQAQDGMSIIIGGHILSSHPMPLIRQIIKQRTKNLTIIGAASASLEVDLLIGAGSAKKVITPYVGAEGLAPIGPFFKAAAERGDIELWECDEGIYYTALRAAALQLPFMPSLGGVGTSLPEVNPDLKLFHDPITGKPLIAVPALQPDVALIHAARADAYGNVQFVGSGMGDRALHRAAKKTIVTVERIVPNEEIRKDPLATALWNVDAIVRAPYGSHPYQSPGFYLHDEAHLNDYLIAARAAVKGDRGPFDAYLDRYIFRPANHAEYLQTVGFPRILSLYEF